MTDRGSGGGDLPSPYLEVGTLLGRYRILRLIDQGGMAVVYEATDERLGRMVALKVMTGHDGDHSDFRERFLRESRFAASLDHPNIIPIYEAGEDAGRLYISMRYVRGRNLAELLHHSGPLAVARVLTILGPVAEALDLAHESGLVHRDVKPANILIARGRDDEHEHPYLTDFGVTKRAAALTRLTATGYVVGTTAYVAPEQIRGEPLDARTDLYAFGCVVYEALTGVPPFVRDDQAALLWAHLSQEPDRVSDHRPEPAAVDPVMSRALAKVPSDRWQSGRELVAALRDAVARPAPTRPPIRDDQTRTTAAEPVILASTAHLARSGHQKSTADASTSATDRIRAPATPAGRNSVTRPGEDPRDAVPAVTPSPVASPARHRRQGRQRWTAVAAVVGLVVVSVAIALAATRSSTTPGSGTAAPRAASDASATDSAPPRSSGSGYAAGAAEPQPAYPPPGGATTSPRLRCSSRGCRRRRRRSG